MMGFFLLSMKTPNSSRVHFYRKFTLFFFVIFYHIHICYHKCFLNIFSLLFYVDIGGKIPIIVRCFLDGRQCSQWEVINSIAKIYANEANERLYYTTANGNFTRLVKTF